MIPWIMLDGLLFAPHISKNICASFAGALFGINPYDQPAVELGKEATFALMGRAGYEELARQIQPVAEIDGDFLV